MDDRLRRMARLGVGNVDVYNNRVGRAARGGDARPLPHIAVVVDELTDLMSAGRDKVEGAVQRLDRTARAAGIHLVMATQRPSAVTAAIKKAFPTRIAFRLASRGDSTALLEIAGAEQLRGEGDMLYWSGSDRTMHVHAPFVSHDEIGAMIACLRDQAEPRYV
jgi:S-DNA-T family DNA segregation ATPase FtsK/SpoIIIE